MGFSALALNIKKSPEMKKIKTPWQNFEKNILFPSFDEIYNFAKQRYFQGNQGFVFELLLKRLDGVNGKFKKVTYKKILKILLIFSSPRAAGNAP